MPKFVFFSNYLNHHQLPFCKEMLKLTNNDFYFVSQKAISEKRIALGYQNISNEYAFNVKTYESKENLDKAYELANDAHIVLFGSSNMDYISKRLSSNKITFKYSERLFKFDKNKLGLFREFRRVFINHSKYNNKPLYMLCAGTYAAYDFNKYGAYKNKTFKWGYFPETREYDIDSLLEKKNKDKINILWAGRLIDWKHPEIVIEIANKLLKDNYDFCINIIGQGELESNIKELITNNNLEEHVNMLGSMNPEEVRNHMEQADIFVFTSDSQEGWGAVLNEAMNSGCACVASHLIGSSCFLIKHKENGLIYESGNIDDLYYKVKSLIDDKEYRERISKEAYKTIEDTWNAKVAANRLLELAECLQNGKDTPFENGPCSKAYPIKENEVLNLIK